MSKMTFFKRIAISAIAALGLGFLSPVASNASVVGHTLSIDAATDAITVGETATAVLTHTAVLLDSTDSVTIDAVVTSFPETAGGTSATLKMNVTDSSTGVAGVKPAYGSLANPFGSGASRSGSRIGEDVVANLKVVTAAYDASNAITSFNISDTTSSSARTVNSTISLRLAGGTKAGTYKVSVFTRTSDNGAALVTATPAATWTVTVTARSTTPNATSESILRAGTAAITGGTASTDSSTLFSTTSATTAVKATLYTVLNNTSGVNDADNAIDSITATVSGEAYVCSSTTYCQSKAQTIASDAAPDADGTPLYFFSTGTAGTATVTVTALNAGLTWTKTLTFYGAATTMEVGTSRYKIARAGGFTTASMFTVTLKDAGGRAVPGQSIVVSSSNYGVIASGTCEDAVGLATDGTYACGLTTSNLSTSGQSATVTMTHTTAALAEITTTYAVTTGGSISSVVLTTDKATYEPGEKMVVTATAKDASGNPVFDGATGPTLSANKQVGGALTMNVYVNGVSTSQTRSATTGLVTTADTLYAPAASGKFRISGLAGDAAATPISVEATVADDAATAAASAATDAALEAIDAANAATDAANLAAEAADAATVAAEEARDAADAATAAVEALATEVATLMAALKAQITTLANTVAKIAKRVRA